MKHWRLVIRLAIIISIGFGLISLGRLSAYGASRQIPMSTDQFLISMGTVKVTIEVLRASQERIIQIADDQARGKYTRTQTQQMIQAEQAQQEGQVSAAVSNFLSRNAQIGKAAFTVPPKELPEELLSLIDYVQTKFPALFAQYVN